MISFDGQYLAKKGLNLFALLNLQDLPEAISATLAKTNDDYADYSQLILIGHAGKHFWQEVKDWQRSEQHRTTSPIDDFSRIQTESALSLQLARKDFKIIFPGPQSIDLQALGDLVGWHHESPMKLGIHKEWGTWFAYRSLVLTRSDFTPVMKKTSQSPCEQCIVAPCVNSCPVGALDNHYYDLPLCLDFRRSSGSQCAETCLARQNCHIGKEQRYSEEQMTYHYRQSLLTIRSE